MKASVANKRAAEFRRGFFQAGVALGIERDRLHRSGVGFHLRAWTVGREFQNGRAVGEFSDPVIFRVDGFLAVLVDSRGGRIPRMTWRVEASAGRPALRAL